MSPLSQNKTWSYVGRFIREALATPGRPGVRVIAKQFGVNPGTVQRISRPFEASAAGL